MDDSVTESKEAKAQTLAKMRDKKDVFSVPIDERLQSSSHEFEFVQKKGAYPKGHTFTRRTVT